MYEVGFLKTYHTRSRVMRSFVQIGRNGKRGSKESEASSQAEESNRAALVDGLGLDARAELIQALIPIGLEAVGD